MITHLSWSALSDYESCGEKYRLRKLARAPQSPMWAGIAGNSVHSVTERKDRLEYFGIAPDGPLTFVDEFERRIAELEADPAVPPREEWHASGRASKANPDKEDHKWWLLNGQANVNNWSNWLERSPYTIPLLDGEPAIEIAVEEEVSEGIPGKGYVDRVLEDPNGALLPVDLKSGAEPKENGQLITYSSALAKKFRLNPNPFQFGMFFMTKKGLATPPAPLLPGLTAVEYRYSNAWRGIKSGIFLPSISNMCSSCSVRNSCVYFSGQVAEEFIPWLNKEAA